MEPAAVIRTRRPGRLWGLVPLAFPLGLHVLTTPAYLGDTTRYAADAVRHAAGLPAQFWEFGHLLWRPWGYAGLVFLGAWFERAFGDTPSQAVVRFLILTSFVCAALSSVLLYALLRPQVPNWAALIVTGGFCASNPFLNYSRAGAPYIPGLFWLLLALGLLAQGVSRRGGRAWWAAAAGLSFLLSAGCWFPYAFAGGALVLFILLWSAPEDASWAQLARQRIRVLAVFLTVVVLASLLMFGLGARAAGIRSAGALGQWVLESDNTWAQRLTAVRLLTGLPRAFFELADDGLVLKRWLLRDPYNPVRPRDLPFGAGLKIFLTYLTGLALWWALARRAEHRRLLGLALAAAVPLLLFAVVIFEPGSPERFLPGFPFFYFAFAGLLGTWPRQRAASLLALIFLLGAGSSNVLATGRWWSAHAVGEVRQRKAVLDENITLRAQVFVLSLRDDLYTLPYTRPLDHSLQAERFQVVDVIETGSRRAERWREEFAARALGAWSLGEEVWISERLLADRPASAWQWVEGDDKRIHWAEIPAFFRPLAYDRRVEASGDGFWRLAPGPGNRARLEREVARPGR